MEPRDAEIDRIIANLGLLWQENPNRRLCDLLHDVCSGPFEGVDDSNLDAWVTALLTPETT